jgi:hypothetical protein
MISITHLFNVRGKKAERVIAGRRKEKKPLEQTRVIPRVDVAFSRFRDTW